MLYLTSYKFSITWDNSTSVVFRILPLPQHYGCFKSLRLPRHDGRIISFYFSLTWGVKSCCRVLACNAPFTISTILAGLLSSKMSILNISCWFSYSCIDLPHPYLEIPSFSKDPWGIFSLILASSSSDFKCSCVDDVSFFCQSLILEFSFQIPLPPCIFWSSKTFLNTNFVMQDFIHLHYLMLFNLAPVMHVECYIWYMSLH